MPDGKFGRFMVEYFNARRQPTFLPQLELPLRHVRRTMLGDDGTNWLAFDVAQNRVSGTAASVGSYLVSVFLTSGKLHDRFTVHVTASADSAVLHEGKGPQAQAHVTEHEATLPNAVEESELLASEVV